MRSFVPKVGSALTLLCLAFMLSLTYGLTLSAVENRQGSNVVGNVIRVDVDTPPRLYYTVHFTTTSGTICESTILSHASPPRPAIKPGDQAKLYYLTDAPCTSVREAGTGGTWLAALFGWLGAAIVGILANRAWPVQRRGRPTARQRRDMQHHHR